MKKLCLSEHETRSKSHARCSQVRNSAPDERAKRAGSTAMTKLTAVKTPMPGPVINRRIAVFVEPKNVLFQRSDFLLNACADSQQC